MYSDGDLVFKKLKTLENMGRIDFLVIEKQGALETINKSTVEKWWIPGCVDNHVD